VQLYGMLMLWLSLVAIQPSTHMNLLYLSKQSIDAASVGEGTQGGCAVTTAYEAAVMLIEQLSPNPHAQSRPSDRDRMFSTVRSSATERSP